VQIGTLYGISVGTGDPELITVKGLRLLQGASIVAFPAGMAGKPGIAEQIVSSWLQPHQQKLALHFPYTQDEVVLLQAWQEAAKEVWQYLYSGCNVAFVCEGDVSFYSTFTYLAQTLAELHPNVLIERVPGVCSPLATASRLGAPLTVRRDRLVILPVLYTINELESILQWAEVVVLMKVSSVYEQVWQLLQKYDLLEGACIVEKATFPDEKIYKDLRQFPSLKLSYFSLMIVRTKLSTLSEEQLRRTSHHF
jgi:precorrin-2/cobalt-factor-2 C20-methyltransferase